QGGRRPAGRTVQPAPPEIKPGSFRYVERRVRASMRWAGPPPDLIGAAPDVPHDVAAEVLANPLTARQRAFKRVVDVALAAVLLVLAVPVLIAAAVAIKLDSRGPIIFRHVRLGAAGRGFRYYKLRSMGRVPDQQEYWALW